MLKIIRDGVTKNLISLLLSVSIVSSCMYIYCPEYIILLTAAIFVIQALVFSFYSYIAQKSVIMRFISVIGSFIGICGLVVIAIQTGQNKNSIDFFVWFLSPQALVTFSSSYITATFIVINFFISSTIYYFSAVRYRISMTFLITMIPFAFYRKEGDSVPVFYAFLLLICYITLMIHCRNMNSKKKQKLIINNGYRKSIGYFLIISTFLTVIIPKPETNFSASVWLSSVIDSEKLSQYMLNKLGIVSNTASSSFIYTKPTNVHLYTFVADELPLNIKSQTFSKYDFNKNQWSIDSCDVDGRSIANTNSEKLNPSLFYEAVAHAGSINNDFADKYNIKDIKLQLTDNFNKSLAMTYSAVDSQYYLIPTLTYKVKNTDEQKVLRAHNGMIYNANSIGKISNISYYSQHSAEDMDYLKLIEGMNLSDYSEFLNDLSVILSEDEKYKDTIDAYIEDYNWADEYLQTYKNVCPPSVKNLAESIADKYYSDYDKAMAIQNYFILSGFKYDINYQKPSDYDISTFLFKSKKGICSDYATAMVILARSAGIPARYAEGIHLESQNGQNTVVITDSDLHAFPELFISGYGWMTFEPTQVSVAENSFLSQYMFSIIIIATVVLTILFLILFHFKLYPYLSDKIFKYKISRSSPEDAVIITAQKIRKYSEADITSSSDEVSAMIKEKYNFNISKVFYLFDSIVYGKQSISPADFKDASEEYNELKEIIKEYNKNERRGRKLWIRKKK